MIISQKSIQTIAYILDIPKHTTFYLSRSKYRFDQIMLFQPNEFIILDLKFTTIHNKLPKTFAPQKYFKDFVVCEIGPQKFFK